MESKAEIEWSGVVSNGFSTFAPLLNPTFCAVSTELVVWWCGALPLVFVLLARGSECSLVAGLH